ncbi:hypothetical protein SASPL_111919 [Salvia splendens]|uniref:Uncharacterized protein n=1 Tax=Salvia splendens TaxID=180675 RepID=A0A8X8Y846_SALSN|nr:hypothetical protein SASPL_111919 [Salvia splendens]
MHEMNAALEIGGQDARETDKRMGVVGKDSEGEFERSKGQGDEGNASGKGLERVGVGVGEVGSSGMEGVVGAAELHVQDQGGGFQVQGRRKGKKGGGFRKFEGLKEGTLEEGGSPRGLSNRCWREETGTRGMINVQLKLSQLKRSLRIWNRTVFGNIFEKLRKAESEAREAQENYEQVPSPELRSEMNRTTAEYLLR